MKRAVAVVAAALLGAGAGDAHHSVSMFDSHRTISISGRIDHFEWTNPHAWIWVATTTPAGGKQVWGFECASLSMLRRMGMTKDSFRPGDQVTITGNPLVSGQAGGMFRSARFADGHVVAFVPGGT